MGNNGFLTIRQKGNLFDTYYNGVAPGTTDLVNSGSGIGYGSGDSSSMGHEGELNKVSIENSGWTAMIIRNNGDSVAARPTIGLDLDVGNNGLDPVDPRNPNHWRPQTGRSSTQSVCLLEGAEPFYGRTYAPTNIWYDGHWRRILPRWTEIHDSQHRTGRHIRFCSVGSYVESEIEYIARWGNSTGQTPADWHIVNVTQRTVAGAERRAPTIVSPETRMPGNPGDQPPPGQSSKQTQNVPYRAAIFNTFGQPNYPVMIDGSLPGDYDEDGVVDTADYVVWRNDMGVVAVKLANESESLGVVNQADYDVWKAHFGQSQPGSGGGNGSAVFRSCPGTDVLGHCLVSHFCRRILCDEGDKPGGFEAAFSPVEANSGTPYTGGSSNFANKCRVSSERI